MRLPRGPVFLLQVSQETLLHLLGTGPFLQVLALGLARIQVRQGGEQPLQLRQEVFGVGGDGWRVNQNFVGDEGTLHLSLPRRERGKNEPCEGSFSQPLTSAWHHVRT